MGTFCVNFLEINVVGLSQAKTIQILVFLVLKLIFFLYLYFFRKERAHL